MSNGPDFNSLELQNRLSQQNAGGGAQGAGTVIKAGGLLMGINLGDANGFVQGPQGFITFDNSRPMFSLASRNKNPNSKWVDNLFKSVHSHQGGGSPAGGGSQMGGAMGSMGAGWSPDMNSHSQDAHTGVLLANTQSMPSPGLNNQSWAQGVSVSHDSQIRPMASPGGRGNEINVNYGMAL